MKFRQQLDRWFRATFLSSLKGGALAVKAFIATSSANALGLPMAPLDLKQLGAIFIGGVLIHFNDCLAAIQLPTETTNQKV